MNVDAVNVDASHDGTTWTSHERPPPPPGGAFGPGASGWHRGARVSVGYGVTPGAAPYWARNCLAVAVVTFCGVTM